jgi:polysaccharide export outer membrane protein
MNEANIFLRLITLLAILSAWGCTTYSNTDAYQKIDREVVVPPIVYIPNMPEAMEIFRPGDILSVENNHTRDRSEYRISMTGRFYYPNAGAIDASGKTPSEVADYLYSKLSKVYKYPHVTVNLIEPANSDVYIGGKVQRPGNYPISPGMTVTQAILKAGGMSKYAMSSKIVLLRLKTDNAYDGYLLDLANIFSTDKKPVTDTQLVYGDIIYILQSNTGRTVDFVDTFLREINPFNLSIGAFYEINEGTVSIRQTP